MMAAAAPNITYSCTTAKKPEEIASLLVFLSDLQKHLFPRSPPADFLLCLPGQHRATLPRRVLGIWEQPRRAALLGVS